MSLQDESDIKHVVNLYGLAVDTQAWELFDQVFTEDVDADYSETSHWRDLATLKSDFEVYHDPFDGTQHTIDKQTVVIGRSKDCDIRISDDPNVSRRHAEIRQEGTAYWLVDLESTNGSTVNGRRQQRAKLESDDRITLGSTDLVFRRSVA